MRELLNATTLSPSSSTTTSSSTAVFGDDLEKCYQCALDSGGGAVGVDEAEDESEGEDGGHGKKEPEEEKPCNKRICR